MERQESATGLDSVDPVMSFWRRPDACVSYSRERQSSCTPDSDTETAYTLHSHWQYVVLISSINVHFHILQLLQLLLIPASSLQSFLWQCHFNLFTYTIYTKTMRVKTSVQSDRIQLHNPENLKNLMGTYRCLGYRWSSATVLSILSLAGCTILRYQCTAFGCRVFCIAGQAVWNSLPDKLRDEVENTFWQSLKTLLFRQY